MDFSPLLIVGAGLLRSVVGWLKNSLADGMIQDFEWRELGETVVRVGLLGAVLLYFPGLNLSGFEASIAAIGGDLVLNVVRKLKK